MTQHVARPTPSVPPRAYADGPPPDVSVVLPCYCAAPLARRSVDELIGFLERAGLSWEVVIVDDGGGDFAPGDWHAAGQVRLLRLPRNRGKGAAVREGMLAARGRVRVYTDVDLPYPLDLIPVIVAYIRDYGYHVVIGDRTLPGSLYQPEIDWRRRVLSRLSSSFIGSFVTGGFFDTQCGLKGMRGDVAEALFGLLRLERFAFDVELVYIALLYRMDIKRIPVRLRCNDTSSVRPVRDAIRGVADILRIKGNQLARRYCSPRIEAIVSSDFASMKAAVDCRAPASRPRGPRAGAFGECTPGHSAVL